MRRHAQHLEGQLRQLPHARPGGLRVVVVFGRNERQVALCLAHEQIRTEQDGRRLFAQEGEVDGLGTWREDGPQPARQSVALAV